MLWACCENDQPARVGAILGKSPNFFFDQKKTQSSAKPVICQSWVEGVRNGKVMAGVFSNLNKFEAFSELFRKERNISKRQPVKSGVMLHMYIYIYNILYIHGLSDICAWYTLPTSFTIDHLLWWSQGGCLSQSWLGSYLELKLMSRMGNKRLPKVKTRFPDAALKRQKHEQQGRLISSWNLTNHQVMVFPDGDYLFFSPFRRRFQEVELTPGGAFLWCIVF